MGGDDEPIISEARRNELLARVKRRTATIGQRIPESIAIDGEPFALREFIMETKSQGAIPPDKRESVRTVRNRLEREQKRRHDRLKSAELTEAAAIELADSILGLERAVTALGNLSEPDFEDQSKQAHVNGTRRWVDFVDQLTD